ncbi:MAG TPA: tRNA (adenosine(37)-N6)-threonylcarbamoyltransferase complex transferase subunit TsaD [Candidatus Latescibacteria bacterium]|nr:tRNA (adenosine(37)-N6)-threonylcarbamoyltransferase complex transferase subunit TsaD [Candidatus Latescibacterota bacterium]HQK22601.1 tRNA (adenosine(37)-N6)-threonylcarbamoyltransferase complex transferase subunit TsaD [Candidatus Latescibacterota bacterium]
MIVLGIESSCDETAAAVFDTESGLRSNVIASQAEHIPFGGVVPEMASRAHTERIVPVVRQALADAGVTLDEIHALAVTAGPGLIGSLLVGVSFAKGVAFTRNLPLVPVHHIEAHVFASRIEHPDLAPPFLALVVSGGHTQLIWVPKWGTYRVLGTTRDDAVGEAFDKVAKILGIGYPGGPLIDRLARDGNADGVKFPKAFIKGDPFAFSFSGLKTAVLLAVEKTPENELELRKADLAASFQNAAVGALVQTTLRAARKMRTKRVVLAGGVASNSALRREMEAACARIGIEVTRPSPVFCTDNAAMTACAGAFWFERGRRAGYNFNPNPRLPLDAFGNE